MDPAAAIAMTAKGQPMKYDEAVDAGVFDTACDNPGELRRMAAAWVADRAAGKLPRDGAPSVWIGRGERASSVFEALEQTRPDLPKTEAAEAVADCVDAGLAGGWPAAIKRERDHLVRLRHTPEAKEAIAAFFAKSK
jgi:enoyl-CoA hydratase/carnithine racemase